VCVAQRHASGEMSGQGREPRGYKEEGRPKHQGESIKSTERCSRDEGMYAATPVKKHGLCAVTAGSALARRCKFPICSKINLARCGVTRSFNGSK
jgi:hypothetical protein